MKRKNLTVILALVLVFALALTGCGGDEAAETTQAATGAAAVSLGLQESTLTATTWSSPNGATINLFATPFGYEEGMSASFLVRLEGEEIANVPCQWDGAQFTASAELNAADGYCYYVFMTAADGNTAEIPVNTPTNAINEALINMETALQSYCSVTVEESAFADGKLSISKGSVQVQAPQIADEGAAITCTGAVMTLTSGDRELDSVNLVLTADEETAAYTADLAGISFSVPAMEEGEQLALTLEVALSNGQFLSDSSNTFLYGSDGLQTYVG